MKSVFSHLALLLPTLEKASLQMRAVGFPVGEAQVWEGEGTLEIYVGHPQSHMGTLLLMTPAKEGAYSRALQKRGPGIHHIAIDVLNIESFLSDIAASGWLLHPRSLQTYREAETIYLCRPGMPTLIEVHEREKLSKSPLFIQEISIPQLSLKDLQMFRALGLDNIVSFDELSFRAQDQKILFSELL